MGMGTLVYNGIYGIPRDNSHPIIGKGWEGQRLWRKESEKKSQHGVGGADVKGFTGRGN